MLVSVSATFAVDEDIALSEMDDEVTIDEDVLSVQEDNDQLSVENEAVVEADDGSNEVLKESNVVTNDTFHNYFDESGSLLETVTDDELIFEGDFSGIDVSYITIDDEIKLTGKNAIFKGVSFVISSNNVVIDGFDLTGSDYALFTIYGVSDVTISNCKINFTAIENSDSYAIYAFSVDNLKIINNNITYVGCTSGSSINNAIRIEGDEEEELSSDDILIQKNNFDITLPSVAVSHPSMFSMENTKIFSAGIDIIYCCGVNITDNEMDIKYNDYYGSVDTIYGISVRGNPMNFMAEESIVSDDILIKNNIIKATGYNYIYGILVAGENFEVSDNQLTISSDNYYANGIEIEGSSENGIVKNNTISLKAPGATYGIISGVLKMGAIDGINYVDNTIDVESYFACGIELSQWVSEITNNYITAKGNYTVGICDSAQNADYSTISNNTINCLGTNVGDDYTGDTILGKESVAIAVLGDVSIENNTISSTNVGIKAVEEGNIVIKNNNITVVANSGKVDNFAVVAEDIDDLTIIGNNVTFSGLVDNQFTIVGYWDEDHYYPIYDTSNNTRAYAVYVKKSNAVIKDNDFDITIPTFAVNWGVAREAFSEGIVLDGCDDVEFTNNNVVISSNGGSSLDTIYGVDVLNSANPLIKDNNITLKSIGYLYAIIIDDENFNISGNNITVTSDQYACGIDVEGPASGVIDANIIKVEAVNSAYGIYTGMTGGDVNVNITGNDVETKAYYAIGLEIAAKKALIEKNDVYADGNHTIGVATKVSDVTINDNAINAFASNEGNQYVWDGMGTLNSAIKVIEGNVTITNNAIASNAIGINADSTNDKVVIEKNEIIVNANSGKVDNFAVVAEDIDDLTIIGNNVTFSGLVDNQFTIVGYWDEDHYYPIYDTSNNTRAYAVYVKKSNAVIKDNDFDITIPTFAVNWGVAREAFSEGIVLDGCDDVEFTNNNVVISSNGGSSLDTIYGVDVLNSANPLIKDNNITLKSIGYLYAIIIDDENFNISGNNITVTSDQYACGIDVEGPANGNITKNTITATAAKSAYPIYSGMNYMPVSVDIVENNISGEAYYVVGIEVGGDKVLVEKNNVYVKGNHTIGIGADLEEIVIDNNNIISEASNIGNDTVWDSLGTDTSGIRIINGNFSISNNNIETTGDYAINSGDANGNITNNELLSSNGEGDNAIIGLGDVNSTGNPATHNKYLKVVMFANDLTKVYGSADQFIVKVLDENGQPVYNKTITFAFASGETFTVNTDVDGFAKLDVDFVKGEYLVNSRFAGDSEYSAKSITNNIVVDPKPTAFTVSDVSVLLTAVKKGYTYKVTLKDNSGNVLANQKVTINGVEFTTDGNGVVNYKLSASKAGNQKLTVNFAGDDKYAATTATATVKITKEATKLTAKKKTFKAKKKSKKYTVTLKDSKGKAISKAKLKIKVGKKTYTAKTNAKGKATFKIKKLTKKGKYTAKITFAGNNLYNKATKSVKITVKK